jgi:hypothetical protein
MGGMDDKRQVRLGAVQETLFIPLADPLVGKAMTITLFRASSPAGDGQDSTARAGGPG